MQWIRECRVGADDHFQSTVGTGQVTDMIFFGHRAHLFPVWEDYIIIFIIFLPKSARLC